MKKMLSCLLIAVLLTVPALALAEGVDFSAMTDAEIQSVIDAGRNELLKRSLILDGETLVFEQEGISLYLTGEMRMTDSGFLYVKAVLVNDSEITVSLINKACSVNGWMAFMNGIGDTAPGKKSSGELQFNVKDTDIASTEDVKEIEFCIDVFDKDTPKTWFTTEPATVYIGE